MELSTLPMEPRTASLHDRKVPQSQIIPISPSNPSTPSSLDEDVALEGQLSSMRPLSSQATILPLSESDIPSFKRIITTLLPVRYPDSFYKKLVTDPDPFSIPYVAFWSPRTSTAVLSSSIPGALVAAICARLQPIEQSNPGPDLYDLYLSQIGTLAPYRDQGLAAHLLETVIVRARVVIQTIATANVESSKLRYVYAHVWETQEDALAWYQKRGFEVGELLPEYYRKLRPKGARVVRMKL